MKGRLEYGHRYRYPHMVPDEIEIWERFMNKFPERFETVDYDFRVGEGAKVEASEPEYHQRMVTMLSQKRIDAMAWDGPQPTIIEIKRRVGLSTLGQVLGYKTLFEVDLPKMKKPKVLVVCESIDADDMRVLKAAGIPFEIV